MELYKRAALHLHGLGAPDRQWLLDQLPEDQREKLGAMLEELTALGIPQKPALLPAPPGEGVDKNRRGSDAVSAYVNEISRADPTTISAILTDEADCAVAAVLKAHDWPWREAVLEGMPESRHSCVLEAMERMEGRVTDKVGETLLRILAERLVDQAALLPIQDAGHPETEKPARRWGFFRRRFWQT